jgi:hypothetical protein
VTGVDTRLKSEGRFDQYISYQCTLFEKTRGGKAFAFFWVWGGGLRYMYHCDLIEHLDIMSYREGRRVINNFHPYSSLPLDGGKWPLHYWGKILGHPLERDLGWAQKRCLFFRVENFLMQVSFLSCADTSCL